MEIAVASSSPLGQYLSELEAEAGGGDSPVAQLPRPAAARKRPRRVSSDWSWLRLVQRLPHRVELLAAHRLIPELCAFHPPIREELQLSVAGSDASAVFADSAQARGGRWTRHVAVLEVLRGVEQGWRGSVGAGGALVVALAVGAAWWEAGGAGVLQTTGWVAAVAASVLLLGLELSVRLLLAWYARRSGRLIGSLNGFVAALEKFNEAYAGSLALVKRAELASRGYRLGAGLLPPIGRLEAGGDGGSEDRAAAENQPRCLPLRRKLRSLNEQLQARASRLVREGEQAVVEERGDPVENVDTVGAQAPSLLLTALAKQRNRSVLLLENAVHTVLVRNVARACSSRDSKLGYSLLHMLGSERIAVEQLIRALSVWTEDLEAWNTSKDPVALLSSDSGVHSLERQHQDQQLAPSNPGDPRLKSVATQLQDLRSASETLTALVIAAQYELLLADSAPERLSSSRDTMQSMFQQLQEAWGSYNSALTVVTGGNNPQDTDAGEEAEGGDCESKPVAVLAPSSVPAPEDANCTVVFSGTSTGDEGFDLRALLTQQEADATASSSGPRPRFVRELRDVLAHREAHTRPGLTKQVDHDPPASSTPVATAGNEVLPPPPPPAADAMFALPRAPPRRRPGRPPPGSAALPAAISASPGDNGLSSAVATAFNLELQALLQRAQPSQEQDIMDEGTE
ncbi:hypothetical protein PHYPSEUDO_004127 [Phytophthora pseudosyringae]|uniref:Myosin-binding domain-containing protein n=1 Tax=Phytophthora pseudosyringae TaxID=221518 RepID=A0A8T1WEH8_9STRA|nr:hypothetical protein PHYPSEUDO_004127 [Phytophthora pseudosyringae]